MQNTIKNFQAKGFEALYFEDSASAKQYLTDNIKSKTIGVGGSMTIADMGLIELLSKENEVFYHGVQGPEALKPAQDAQIYLTSANGISQDGQIVNIDGFCNRIASSIFGLNREKVYFICGKNKLAKNLEEAIFRAKNIAAPKNAQRLNKKTPCAIKADKCYNCNSPERICRLTSIMSHPPSRANVAVILINENLGY